ncbi:MAG: hypothetical protein QM811_24735 [Pirellulales bacterium]
MQATQHTSWSANAASLLCAAICALSCTVAFADDYRPQKRAGSVSTARRTTPEELPAAYDPTAKWGTSGPSLVEGLTPPPPVVDQEIFANPVDARIPFEEPATPWSSGSWFMSGRRYVQVDAVFGLEVRPKNDRVVLAADTANPNRVLTTYGRTFGIEPGMRMTLGTYLDRDYQNRDHSLEFSFLMLGQFHADDGITGLGSNSIVSPINTGIPGFSGAGFQTTTLDTQYSSFEVNYKIRKRLEHDRMVMGPDGTWTRQFTKGYVPSMSFGVRYVNYDEDFLWLSRRDGVAPATFGGDYAVSTNNDMLGVQFGGELLDQYETWYWGIRGKGGAYVNFSDLDRNIVINGSVVRDEHASLNAAAFVGEVGFVAAYQMSPNWTLRASYDLIFMGGVATHTEQVQFNFDPITNVENNGMITLQVFSLGMEMVW